MIQVNQCANYIDGRNFQHPVMGTVQSQVLSAK